MNDSRHLVNLNNVVEIDGERYLSDFILIPICEVDSKGKLRSRFIKLYQRINLEKKEKIESYIIKKKLSLKSKEMYFHPAIPFQLEKSTCKDWLSWKLVTIPSASGSMEDGEIVKLIRIRPGPDTASIDVKTTKLSMLIECEFDPYSELNWSNWLNLEKKVEVKVEANVSLSEKICTEDKMQVSPPLFCPNKKVKSEKGANGEDEGGADKQDGEGDETNGIHLATRRTEIEKKNATRKLEESSTRMEPRATASGNAVQNQYFPQKRVSNKMDRDGREDCVLSDDERTTSSWGSNVYFEEKPRPYHRRSTYVLKQSAIEAIFTVRVDFFFLMFFCCLF